MSHSLVDQILALPVDQQLMVYHELRSWMICMDKMAGDAATVSDIRETRFSRGLRCPRCFSEKVKRNGTVRNKQGYTKQRYLCRGCGRSFNDLTGTPLAYSKKQHLWAKNALCMAQAKSVRKTAEILGVHPSTAFRWRHKVLNAIRAQGKTRLAGVVEVDETFVLYSEKGSRKLSRPARKRGGKAQKRGLSREQVCIVVAQDRQGGAVAQKGGMGAVTLNAVRHVLGGVVAEGAIVCTDGAGAYSRFCREVGAQLVRVDRMKRLRGSIYHINNVNNWHKRFKDWYVKDLRGVATKYLDNYTTWFIILDGVKKVDPIAAAKQVLSQSCRAYHLGKAVS